MKILSIGNSFSEDAQRWLHSLAKLHGTDIQCAKLYIGGCSLETHWKNFEEHNAFYDYQVNGNEAKEKVSINDALLREKWDIVTLQQVSDLSGLPESYEPYISALYEKVKAFSVKDAISGLVTDTTAKITELVAKLKAFVAEEGPLGVVVLVLGAIVLPVLLIIALVLFTAIVALITVMGIVALVASIFLGLIVLVL